MKGRIRAAGWSGLATGGAAPDGWLAGVLPVMGAADDKAGWLQGLFSDESTRIPAALADCPWLAGADVVDDCAGGADVLLETCGADDVARAGRWG